MHQIGIGQLAVRARPCLKQHDQIIRAGRKRRSNQHCQQEQQVGAHGQWVTLVM